MFFILIHSPLVGPSTWLPVARELEQRGHQAVVPPLVTPVGAPARSWQQAVAAGRDALTTLSSPFVLVGHSGGGLLLPAIAGDGQPPVSKLIFVDSGIPASVGETPLVPPFVLEHLRSLAADGILPPWSAWFGEDTMRELVPDPELLTALTQEMPSIPFTYFEQSIPSPGGWDRIPCAYLLLSDAYRESAAEARERGWPVEEIAEAQHLHIVVAPEAVTDALLRLALR